MSLDSTGVGNVHSNTDYPLLRSLLSSPSLFSDVSNSNHLVTSSQGPRQGHARRSVGGSKRKLKGSPFVEGNRCTPARCSPDTTVKSPPPPHGTKDIPDKEAPLSPDQENTLLSLFACDTFSDQDRLHLAARVGISKNRVQQWASRQRAKSCVSSNLNSTLPHSQQAFRVPGSDVDYFALQPVFPKPSKRLKRDDIAYATPPFYATPPYYATGFISNPQSLPFYMYTDPFQCTPYPWLDSNHGSTENRYNSEGMDPRYFGSLPDMQYHPTNGYCQSTQYNLPNSFPHMSQRFQEYPCFPAARPMYYYEPNVIPSNDITRVEHQNPFLEIKSNASHPSANSHVSDNSKTELINWHDGGNSGPPMSQVSPESSSSPHLEISPNKIFEWDLINPGYQAPKCDLVAKKKNCQDKTIVSSSQSENGTDEAKRCDVYEETIQLKTELQILTTFSEINTVLKETFNSAKEDHEENCSELVNLEWKTSSLVETERKNTDSHVKTPIQSNSSLGTSDHAEVDFQVDNISRLAHMNEIIYDREEEVEGRGKAYFENVSEDSTNSSQAVTDIQQDAYQFDSSFWEDVERSIENYTLETTQPSENSGPDSTGKTQSDVGSWYSKDNGFATGFDQGVVSLFSSELYPNMIAGDETVAQQESFLNTIR